MEINLLKHITIKRTLNALKIITSFSVSKFIRKPVVWGMPISYSVEPTNYCNLKCPECPSGLGTLTRPLGLLKMEFFREIIDQISGTGFYIQLFFQGEPFINKELVKMIGYAQSKNMYVAISTNGHTVTEKNIESILDNPPDKLIFSIDGLDEETYQNYRVGGTFKQADKGLRLLMRSKKERSQKFPFVEFQFIVMKQNEHQIDDVFKYGRSLGVDKIVLKTMQVSSYENALRFLPENEKYRRYLLKDNKVSMKGHIKNHCFALWRTSVITWDGRVVPCCFDKDAVFTMNTLNGRKFGDIWKSEEYQKFRNKILTDRSSVEMCTNCTEGLKINILEIES